MIDCPRCDFFGHDQAVRVGLSKRNKRFDGLRRTLDIDGIGLVMKVFRAPVPLKEMISIELQSLCDTFINRIVLGDVPIEFHGGQVVTSVKIVDPVKLWFLGVIPRTVFPLSGTAIRYRSPRHVEIFVVVSEGA